MRILHLVEDDGKFIDPLIRMFDSFGCHESRFAVLCARPPEGTSIRNRERVEWVVEGSPEYRALCVWAPDLVWVHYRDPLKERFVRDCRPAPAVMWSVWGGDFYDFSGMRLYGRETLRLLRRSRSFPAYCRDRLHGLLASPLFRRLYLLRHGDTRRFLARVRFFSTVVPTEVPLVAPLLPRSALPVYFVYGGDARPELPVVKPGWDVWVGNSASLTNNHFEAFTLVKAALPGSRVAAPLSYGQECLRDRVIGRGRADFGDGFTAFCGFMPYGDYVKEMAGRSIFVFGHVRQQAVGNVGLALCMGGCVFLDRRSPVYAFFRREGVDVFPLEDLRAADARGRIAAFFDRRQAGNVRRARGLLCPGNIRERIGRSLLRMERILEAGR